MFISYRRNPDIIKLAEMGQQVVTKADDKMPYVGTHGLASCVGISVYDHKARVGGVAHVFFNETCATANYIMKWQEQNQQHQPNQQNNNQNNNQDKNKKREIIDFECIPGLFDNFCIDSSALIQKADDIGGSSYVCNVFHVNQEFRNPRQNRLLYQTIDEHLSPMLTSGKLTNINFRNETQFILDTKTGIIIPRFL